MKVQFAETGGARFRIAVEGQGEPVLLLHGGYSNLTVWDGMAEGMAQEYKVIRYDQRGYGESSAPNGPFSYHEDVRAILDYCNIRQADIVGSSFGGGAALDFAIQYPELVRKLILIAPAVSGLGYPFRMKWEGLVDYLRANRTGMDKAADAFMKKAFWRYLVPKEDSYRKVFKELYVSNAGFYKSKPTWNRPLSPPALTRLEEIRHRVWIIEPERDHPFNRKACGILHSRIAGAERIVMKDAGHYPHLEKPVETESLLLEILRCP